MGQLIYIVRHGNTFDKGESVTRVGARTDLELSSSGAAQARSLAKHFADAAVSFGAAYCSPLLRTRQTAEIILATQTWVPTLQTAEFLREVDYGPDENQPEHAVVDRLGMPALDAWDRDAVVPNGWKVDPDGIRRSWQAFFSSLDPANHAPVLVVTSNGIARFALQLASGASASHELKLKTGAYGVFTLSQTGDLGLKSWNVRP